MNLATNVACLIYPGHLNYSNTSTGFFFLAIGYFITLNFCRRIQYSYPSNTLMEVGRGVSFGKVSVMSDSVNDSDSVEAKLLIIGMAIPE